MNRPLRKCPLCGHDASDIDIGLRDYRWCTHALPGKVSPMDFDFVLERGGAFLMMDFKPEGATLGAGIRRTYASLVKTGYFDVWVVRGDGPVVTVGPLGSRGQQLYSEACTVDDLALRVAKWWEEAA